MRQEEEEIEAYVVHKDIFEELEIPNPQEARAKAELSIQIHETIKRRKLTQKQAAEIMGIDQPKVSEIVRGRLKNYTLDRLIRFVRLLGKNVKICVEDQPKRTKNKGYLIVDRVGKGSHQRRAP